MSTAAERLPQTSRLDDEIRIALASQNAAVRAEIVNEACCDIADRVGQAYAEGDPIEAFRLQWFAIVEYMTADRASAKAYLTKDQYEHIFTEYVGHAPTWADDDEDQLGSILGEDIRRILA